MRSLGGFQLGHQVGTGVLGDTWLCVGENGEQAAVKMLHREWGDPRRTGRWARGVVDHLKQLGSPAHPHAARYATPLGAGYDEHEQRAWIASPWFASEPSTDDGHEQAIDLISAVASRRLPAEAALYLLWQLAGLARHLHSRQLTLAGLKPSNLFLTARGAHVVDAHVALGLRGLLQDPGSRCATSRPTAHLWAEVTWLPPELRRWDSVARESSSVYAMAAALTYACTGNVLYPPVDVIDALMQRKAARVPAEQSLAQWATQYGNPGRKVRKAVLRSLRQRPSARPSARRLIWLTAPPLRNKQLLQLCHSAWTSYVRSVLPRSTPPPPRAPRRPPALGASPRRHELDTGQPSTQEEDTHVRAAVPDPRTAPAEASPASAAVRQSDTVVSSTHHGGSRETWRQQWSEETGGPMLCAPVRLSGHLLVTSGDTAQLLDEHTGERKAVYPLPGPAESTPVSWGRRLWWSQRDGTLTGHDLKDAGDAIRLHVDGDPGTHSPVVADGDLVIGTTRGLFSFRQDELGIAPRARPLAQLCEPLVTQLATDGTHLWIPSERRGVNTLVLSTGELRSPIEGWDSAGCTPTVTANGVYIGAWTGHVRVLGPVGVPYRQCTASTFPITAPPALHGGLVLVVDRAGAVMALSPDLEDIVWSAYTDTDGRGPVTVAHGTVYVCGANSVRCLDARSGRETTPLTTNGPKPVHVTATSDRLHVSFADGRLTTWCRT
ncbi:MULTISPECIES: PQQ-binding-like beta-propeller repeat protein [unclassified Streptomyces]|uniref:outer membrane protein assembly factor BamB family protein n=1 Tax=unclassified Streptomyces TaxID=2593676 RepID=UPI0036E27F03